MTPKKVLAIDYTVNMMTLLLLSIILAQGMSDDWLLSYEGSQFIIPDENAYGGSYRFIPDGTVTFSFYGSGFAVLGVQDENGGSAEVCVIDDEDECHSVSFYSTSPLYNVNVINMSNLASDTVHTISITGAFNLDAVYIAPPIIEPSPSATPPAWLMVNETGDGLVENRITSGDQANFIVLVVMAITLLVIAIVNIFEWLS
jgi:hypothetical protein